MTCVFQGDFSDLIQKAVRADIHRTNPSIITHPGIEQERISVNFSHQYKPESSLSACYYTDQNTPKLFTPGGTFGRSVWNKLHITFYGTFCMVIKSEDRRRALASLRAQTCTPRGTFSRPCVQILSRRDLSQNSRI